MKVGDTALFHDGAGRLKHGIIIGTCPDGTIRIQTALAGIYTVPVSKARMVDSRRLLEVLEPPKGGWLPRKKLSAVLSRGDD